MTLHVRAATPDDVPAAADALVDAFTDYPWTRWTVDADGHGDRLRALNDLYLSAVAVPFGRVDLGEEGQELVGVAVWLTSTGVADAAWARIGPAAAVLAGNRAAAAAAAEEALADRRPSEPHVILGSLGVVRHRQRQGLGAALLAPGLEEADRCRLNVHLETSTERNVRFYRRLGFAVTDVVELHGGGPRTWLMLRRPVTTAADPA